MRLSEEKALEQSLCSHVFYSAFRPFNWTTLLVPVHKRRQRTDLLMEACPALAQQVVLCPVELVNIGPSSG